MKNIIEMTQADLDQIRKLQDEWQDASDALTQMHARILAVIRDRDEQKWTALEIEAGTIFKRVMSAKEQIEAFWANLGRLP